MHHRGIIVGLTGFFMAGFLWQSCKNAEAEPQGYFHKDLSEQMDALAIFQGSIGEELRRGNTNDALWFVDGLDSVLLLISDRLNEHPNLLEPFEKYYQRKLRKPIIEMRKAIDLGDTANAQKQYRLLVNRCNSCHNEHGVEERAHF